MTLNVFKLGECRTAATSFIRAISTVIHKAIVDDLNSQEYLSVLIDGSTDVAVKEQKIVHAKVKKKANLLHVFWEVKSGTAEGILTGLEEFFESISIPNWKKKLVGLESDGESVNSGSRGGLGVPLKAEIPYLIHVCLIAHKLELSVLDACKLIDLVESFQKTVQCLLKFYSHSGKCLSEVSHIGDILHKEVKSFGKWNPIR